jgi:L-ascorbate metabolism protein UlaG (beta-lactamase superfamily)
MTITYHGHSTFKIKGKIGTVVTDPFNDDIGLTLPKMSADIITVSHDHSDHNAVSTLTGTARRKNPFIVTDAGEYEVGGISVFGVQTFHDETEGSDRGHNIVFTTLVDGMRICHLGDLGHELTPDQLEEIGNIDILFCPVGGKYTINPELAVKTIRAIEPGIAIPMHYKTDKHNKDVFGELKTLEEFLKVYGVNPTPVAKLDVSGKGSIPEETELVVLGEV